MRPRTPLVRVSGPNDSPTGLPAQERANRRENRPPDCFLARLISASARSGCDPGSRRCPRWRQPNERWSTDLCRVWAGRDGRARLALVGTTVHRTVVRSSSLIDGHTRALLGWHLSRSGKASTAASALEHALINRFGTLGRVTSEFLLRSDNGLVFTSRKYTTLVRSYGLNPKFITPRCPQQNGWSSA